MKRSGEFFAMLTYGTPSWWLRIFLFRLILSFATLFLTINLMLDAVLHNAYAVAKHRKQLRQRNQYFQFANYLQPVQRLLLDLRRRLLKTYCHKIVHCFRIESEWRHFRIENFAQNNFQFDQFLFGHIIRNRFHPVRHHNIPYFRCDHFVRHEANESLQTLFQVAGTRCQCVPVAADTRIFGRMRQQTRNEFLVMAYANLLQPTTNVFHFQFLDCAFHFAVTRICGHVEPMEEHRQQTTQYFHWRVSGRCASSDQQPNAVSTKQLTFFQRNIILHSVTRAKCSRFGGIATRLKIQRLRLAQQTYDRLDHIRLHFRIHLPGRWQTAMHNVIATATTIVPIAMALRAISDGMIAIITGAFRWKANRHGRFVGRSTILHRNTIGMWNYFAIFAENNYVFTYLILANHRYLGHRMQNIAERLIWIFSVNFVCAFDA